MVVVVVELHMEDSPARAGERRKVLPELVGVAPHTHTAPDSRDKNHHIPFLALSPLVVVGAVDSMPGRDSFVNKTHVQTSLSESLMV